MRGRKHFDLDYLKKNGLGMYVRSVKNHWSDPRRKLSRGDRGLRNWIQFVGGKCLFNVDIIHSYFLGKCTNDLPRHQIVVICELCFCSAEASNLIEINCAYKERNVAVTIILATCINSVLACDASRCSLLNIRLIMLFKSSNNEPTKR